jgi:siroheme synthase-like protein
VGAGPVATEKLTAVLNNSPLTHIKIVAKEISDPVRSLIASKPNIAIFQKEFEAADLINIDLVISAVNNREISVQIREIARKNQLLINVADTPDLCDFYLGGIVQKGYVKIGISTNGKSPTMAKRLKEMLQHALPDELDEMIENLHVIRNQLKGDFQDKVKKLNEITKGLVE